MSESRSFLARWSERKRAEARAERAQEQSEPHRTAEQAEPYLGAEHAEAHRGSGAEASTVPDSPAPGTTRGDPAAPVDLEALPSLEDITGETDIGAFLRRGVPGDLRNAALRRAWTSDPTISRFIEMADYDWDFNTPGGNQVFGPLSSAIDAARMAAEILNPPPRETPEPTGPGVTAEGPEGSRPALDAAPPTEPLPVAHVVFQSEGDDHLTPEVNAPIELSDIPASAAMPMSIDRESPEILEIEIALRNPSTPELESHRAQRRKRHGGALPDSK